MRHMDIFVWFLIGCAALTALCLLVALVTLPLGLLLNAAAAFKSAFQATPAESPGS